MQIKTIVRYHLTPDKRLTSKRQEILLRVSEDVKKREHLCTDGGSANWHNHYGKQYGGSLKI